MLTSWRSLLLSHDPALSSILPGSILCTHRSDVCQLTLACPHTHTHTYIYIHIYI